MFGVVSQWTAQYDKALVDEGIYEHGMFSPTFLISHRAFVVPLRTLLLNHDEMCDFLSLPSIDPVPELEPPVKGVERT